MNRSDFYFSCSEDFPSVVIVMFLHHTTKASTSQEKKSELCELYQINDRFFHMENTLYQFLNCTMEKQQKAKQMMKG